MRFLLHLRVLAVVAILLTASVPRADAQSFGLSVTQSADSLLVNNSLTYTISVTNLTFLSLVDAQVTNQFSASFQFVSTSAGPGTYTTSSSNVIFDLGAFPYPGIAQLTLTVQPTATNSFTNTVTVGSVTVTNIAFTNIVALVTNAVTLADLGVTVAGPVQPVVTNDWMTYSVTATNFGPSIATGTMLTNTLPPGVVLLGAKPANYSANGSNLIFNLGTLASGVATNFQFTIQPTNVGPLTLSASIGSGVQDTNTANNSASTTIVVTNYFAGPLVAFTNSSQITNFLNGLLEQGITVSNAGLASVFAARVVVSGLTNRLFNAFGTNSGNPFVVCLMPSGSPLAPGQSVDALLQYSPRRAFPFTNGQLQAFSAPIPDLTPPPVTVTGTNVNLTRILRLANGNMLIEWPALTNRTYTVVYSDNILFSNALIAPPSIVAPANDVEWIDYGPPTTVSTPMNSSNRFYRVLLNP